MEVHPTSIQYLKCMNCQRFLGKGCLICELGHSSCSKCSNPGETCKTCETYVSGIRDPGSSSENLRPNIDLELILKKIFSRCRNSKCNRLIPMYVYEDHVSECRDTANFVACIHGCGVIEKCIASHLINEHEIAREENFVDNVLRIYPQNEDWSTSKWNEKIIHLSETTSLLVSPKIEKKLFVLGLFTLSHGLTRMKVKVKKGWNSFTFLIVVPNYDEKFIPVGQKNSLFWNCDLNTIKKSYVDTDEQGQPCLKINLVETL